MKETKSTKREDTVTPGLRVNRDKWKRLNELYPKQINKMFNQWIDELIAK